MEKHLPPPRRVLLTGASGFIGSHLLKGLKHCELATLSHHNASFASIRALLADFQADTVIHVASLFRAEHSPSEVESLCTGNITFGALLLEALIQTKGHAKTPRLINTGTSWQHFENAAYRPVNLYAATKQAFSDICAYYSDVIDITTLELYDTYGPGDTRKKLISLLFDAALNEKKLDMSPGEQFLGLTHVDDVVSAYNHALHAPLTPASYSIRPQETLCLRSLVSVIEKIAERPMHVTFGGRSYRKNEMMVLPTLTPPLPHWSAQIPLEIGLRHCWNVYVSSHSTTPALALSS